MSLFKNWRYNPFTGVMNSVDITAEVHTIGYQDDWNAYGIQLDEAPQLTAPSSVEIRKTSDDSLFTEVPRTQAPSTGQFRVDYDAATYFGTGRIEFNSADNGIEVKVNYKGGGGLVKSRNALNQLSTVPTSLTVEGDLVVEVNAQVDGDIDVAGDAIFGTIPELPASDPTTDNQAVRKKYVDDEIDDVIPKTPYLDKQVLTPADSIAIDWSAYSKASCLLNRATTTFTFSANPAAPTTLLLALVQDGSGGRAAVFPAGVKWMGGDFELTSDINAIDIVNLYYDGTNYYATVVPNFS